MSGGGGRKRLGTQSLSAAPRASPGTTPTRSPHAALHHTHEPCAPLSLPPLCPSHPCVPPTPWPRPQTCVSHNSMRVSRRLLGWGADDRAEGPHHLLQHAAYYERTMLNAVLGTQRGTEPGAMLYMYPMGSGVSKASFMSGSELHHWGGPSTHWCCQGTGLEAFAQLADSVFWSPARAAGTSAAAAGQLFVLQPISSKLAWDAQHCAILLEAETPGSRAATEPLTTVVSVVSVDSARPPGEFVLWVRVPGWVHEVAMSTDGGLALGLDGDATPGPVGAEGELVAATFVRPPVDGAAGPAGRILGSLTLRWSMALRWERIADHRPRFRVLHSAVWGPLVLAGLTRSERALDVNVSILPVPPLARSQLVSLQSAAAPSNASASRGCLVTRWGRVWVVWPDRTRSFVGAPTASCTQRATPVSDELNGWAQRGDGKGRAYLLDRLQSASACEELEGCLRDGSSPFADGALFAMHNGTGRPIVLASRPPTVNGTRRGGTDAANAASWRVTPAPLSHRYIVSSDGEGQVGGATAVFLEAMDVPGYVLTASLRTGAVELRPAEERPLPDAVQRWLLVSAAAATAGAVVLESAEQRGRCSLWLR